MTSIWDAKHVLPEAYVNELTYQFGSYWYEWEPETLWSEIRRIFGTEPSGEVKSKIGAIRVFMTTDLFFTDAPTFENIVLAVNDLFYDPTVLEIASPEEILYAITALSPLRPDVTIDYNREIVGYIRTSCRKDGLLVYPRPLQFAQPRIPEELQSVAEAIKPNSEIVSDSTDMVQVQSLKLYNLWQYVSKKIAANQETLVPSTE